MDFELQHLRALIALAEERHFGRAAERLHLTQPTLSRQIRRLEEAIDADLIDRTTRPLRLTPSGTSFLQDAHFILGQAQRAAERGRRPAGSEVRQLSVGSVAWTYTGFLPRILGAFRTRFPDTVFELSVRSPYDQVEALENQWLDLGFVRPVVVSRRLRIEPLLEERLVAVVPERHPLAKRRQVSLEELAAEPFISIPRIAAPGFDFMQATFLAQRGRAPTVLGEAPDPQAQLALIAAGLGVGLHIAPAVNRRERGVAFIALEDEVPTVPLALLWRREDGRELVRGFIETAHEVTRSLGS